MLIKIRTQRYLVHETSVEREYYIFAVRTLFRINFFFCGDTQNTNGMVNGVHQRCRREKKMPCHILKTACHEKTINLLLKK